MPMTHTGRAAAYFFAVLAIIAACSPEREILSSLQDSGAADSNNPDQGNPPPEPKPCTAKLPCPPGELCVAVDNPQLGLCRQCSDPRAQATCKVPCPSNSKLETYPSFGCDNCVCEPPNQCTTDLDCAKGQRCYPGNACDPTCAGDPKCCHGNFCAAPGCTDTTGIECSLVGCPSGQRCSSDCAAPQCICDTGSGLWKCGGGCGATCQLVK